MPQEPCDVVIDGLQVTYAGRRHSVPALGPLDLQVARGEFVSVVGPSGCGKTTLAKVVAGLLPPTAGHVSVTPRESDAVVPVATVFQDFAIFPWKTVLQNVRFGLTVNGIPRDEATERARTWIDRLGLAGFEDSYPAALSGGMQQRVGIARAFAVDPDILIMDEPFGSLDAQLREIAQGDLLELHQERQCSVILITHSLEEALVLSDRVAVLSARPGRLVALEEVPFERPRASTIRRTQEFALLRERLWSVLRSHVSTGGGPHGPGTHTE